MKNKKMNKMINLKKLNKNKKRIKSKKNNKMIPNKDKKNNKLRLSMIQNLSFNNFCKIKITLNR